MFTPEEVDRLLDNAQIYTDGIKVDGVFYTFEEWSEMHDAY